MQLSSIEQSVLLTPKIYEIIHDSKHLIFSEAPYDDIDDDPSIILPLEVRIFFLNSFNLCLMILTFCHSEL